MKFIEGLGWSEEDSAYLFEFEKHTASDVCIGDQIWSDGYKVYVYDYVEQDVLEELISSVSNRKAFKGALRRAGCLFD